MKRNVPKLRFKGFEDEWKIDKLDENTYIKGRIGWKNLKQEEYTEEGPYLIAGKHIKNGNIKWGKCDHISEERYTESMEIALKNGDIIFSKDGSIGNPALIKNLNNKATINGTMMLIRLDSQKYISDYFYQVLRSVYFERLIRNVKSGSSIPHIFQRDMIDFKFPMTSLPEQEKIANFLTKVDSLIEEQTGKVADLEKYKKGMMQKIFSQEIRFKDENYCEYPKWEEKELENIMEFFRGSGLNKTLLDDNGSNKCILYGELFTKYKISISKVISKTNSSEGILSKKGDILMPTSDVTAEGLATASCLNLDNVQLGGDINILRPIKGMSSEFFSYQINYNKRKIIEKVSGTTVKHIYIKDIKNILYLIPCLEEQTKIANFLSNIDKIIEEENGKLEDLITWKKGLLQQMFV